MWTWAAEKPIPLRNRCQGFPRKNKKNAYHVHRKEDCPGCRDAVVALTDASKDADAVTAKFAKGWAVSHCNELAIRHQACQGFASIAPPVPGEVSSATTDRSAGRRSCPGREPDPSAGWT